MSNIPADWYPDPDQPKAWWRWWDGVEWTSELEEMFYEDMKPKRRPAERVQPIQVVSPEQTYEYNDIQNQIASARQELAVVNGEVADARIFVELGIRNYVHPADTSVALADRLALVKERYKQLAKSKRDAYSIDLHFNGSSKDGDTFSKDIKMLAVNLYNSDVENIIKTARTDATLYINRARATAAKIERFGRMMQLKITDEYQRVREEEITLAVLHKQALEAEKEAERERKEVLREQAKVEAEIKKQKEKLQKESSHYGNVIAKLQADLLLAQQQGTVDANALAAKESELQDARNKMHEVEEEVKKTDFRAANIRAGYVYVISNIGAFGEHVVKIGMTRRLEPSDRVKELGDASVPFRFDTHALIFSDDAVSLEGMLHDAFDSQRVNLVNRRREFFYTTPQEVLNVLKSHQVNIVEFSEHATADEFRESQRNRQISN